MAYSSSKKPSALNAASTPLGAANQIVLDQNGNVVRAALSDVEAKMFDAKTALSSPAGTEVVVVRQTDNTLRQVALSNIIPDLNITNDEISPSAAIADTKLATINTAGKVTNNAVQAVSTNTANRIVTRDGSGNFAAGIITASVAGNATTATTANQTAATLTRGTYLTGANFNGSSATTWAVDATDENTASKVVARDASGNFAAGTITANLTGNVTGNVTGNLTGTASAIADNIVSTAKIVDGAVTQDKLGPDIVLIPAGAVMSFAMNSVPTGWLACNGNEYAKVGTYAALFAAIGTTYGETNGSGGVGTSHFRVPDLRGYFVRGSGTNSDLTASGTFGQKQTDSFKAHTHAASTASAGWHSHTGGTNEAGWHAHYYERRSAINNRANGGGSTAHTNVEGAWTGGAGNHTHTVWTDGAGDHTHAITVTSTGSSETNPKNIAMLYCIKF